MLLTLGDRLADALGGLSVAIYSLLNFGSGFRKELKKYCERVSSPHTRPLNVVQLLTLLAVRLGSGGNHCKAPVVRI